MIAGRPRLVDGLLVTITLVPGLVGEVVAGYSRVPPPVMASSLVLVVFMSVPLWWRRRRPVAVLTTVSAALLAGRLLGQSQTASVGAIIFAVYAVSVYGGATARLWAAALTALVTTAGFIVALTVLNTHSESLLTLGPPALVAWVIGDYVRGRRLYFQEFLAHAKREAQAAREQAAEEERLRIARELHDVVAHRVSVIAIQAGASRVSGNSSQEALQSIESTARDTLIELNRLLGVLRKNPGAAERLPQPGLGQIDSLLRVAREGGLEVDLRITGDQRPLAPALDLTAFRIAQEAITNALKHAHASRLEVRVAYLRDALELTVRDNGEDVRRRRCLPRPAMA